MCRSIKQLRLPDAPATEAEIQAAALQYVRKVSGYRAPSKANQAAFDAAVAEVALATQRLLDQLGTGNRATRTAAQV
ncbi:MAG: DUF2277 domain-containing protein [Caldilineaceae bacterium]